MCYHLLINHGNLPVGIINIVLPHHKTLDDGQAQLLSNLAPDFAISLYSAKQRQEKHAIEVENAANNERLEIARDLHDTVGQNLGYLHFKLDQILTNGEKAPLKALYSDLEGLRDVANESYELLRNTLVILTYKTNHQISELFNAHSQLFSKRTGIPTSIYEEGEPHFLPPDYLKQLLFAFKESLSNIGKHSQASQAKVSLVLGR